jgi:protein-S-isoprenylcysteine O-methyltransferase Ste14
MIRSATLVAVQLAAIVYLALTGHLLAAPRWIWLQIAGIALTLWAVAVVDPRRVKITPEPARGMRLVTRGPYRFIRHPMYTAVLLFTLGWLTTRPTFSRLLVWLILLADLILKAEYEESLLVRRFPEYRAYRQRTKRFVPFVY